MTSKLFWEIKRRHTMKIKIISVILAFTMIATPSLAET